MRDFIGGSWPTVMSYSAQAPTGTFFRSTAIGSGGGWGELIVKLTSDNNNVFYAGAGTDDPKDQHLLTGSGRSKNSFSWASYFHKFNDNVTAALEWSNWQFKTRTFVAGLPSGNGTPGRGNVFNLALAYQF